ncbi:MAG: hypothetical protein IJC68_02905, partial [Firmicutes bacterium]|nr:hypothetical protein [Bacillota bacterium]
MKRIAFLLALLLTLCSVTVYANQPTYTDSPVSDTVTGTRLTDQQEDFTVILSRVTAAQQISANIYLYDVPVDSYVAVAPAEGNESLFASLSYYDSADSLLRTASLMSNVKVQIRNITGPQMLAPSGAFDEKLRFDTRCEVFN